jgi:hypothetical protein
LGHSCVDRKEVCGGIVNLDLEMSILEVGFEDKIIVEREGLSEFMKESWMPDFVKGLRDV